MNSRLRPIGALPLVIFAIASFVRLVLLSHISERDMLHATVTDGRFQSGDEALQIAVSLAEKGRFSDPFCLPTGPTAHVPPSFPAVTALVFRILGTGHTGALVRNLINIFGFALMFALLPAASAAVGIRWQAGALAGLIAALYPLFRSTEVFHGRDEWLATLLLMGVTVAVYRLSGTPSLRWAVVVGLGWGALMYVQPSTLTVLPIHLVIFLASARGYPRALLMKYSGLVVVLMVVLTLPWIIRNRLVLGGWTFVRDNLGVELRVSNGAGASPSQEGNQAGRWYWTVHPGGSPKEALKVREVGELRYNREVFHQATDWIANNQAAFWRLTLQRALFFWTDMPSNRSTFLLRAGLSLAAFLGLVLMWRNGLRLQAALFGAILLAYPPLYYIVQYSNRYVATISFAIMIPAAFTFTRFAALLRPTAAASNWRRSP